MEHDDDERGIPESGESGSRPMSPGARLIAGIASINNSDPEEAAEARLRAVVQFISDVHAEEEDNDEDPTPNPFLGEPNDSDEDMGDWLASNMDHDRDAVPEIDMLAPSSPENFDTDLPLEHSYMGEMSRVPGVNYLDSNKMYRIVTLSHDNGILFPGEIFPMIVPMEMILELNASQENGLLFGVHFSLDSDTKKGCMYGVTCQIFEKSERALSLCTFLKTRVLQRFVMTVDENPGLEEYILFRYGEKTYANVRILPEINLPDPLSSVNLGCANRLRTNPSMSKRMRSLQAAITPWPEFVYDQYDVTKIIQKAKKYVENYHISNMPEDPVMLSFWLARNLVFSRTKRMEIFRTNVVNERIYILGKYLADGRTINCKTCNNKITECGELFAMSKSGVQSNYCNPAGYIHETNTVYDIYPSAAKVSGNPSVRFSWFPGYSWQIINCAICRHHLGWKFDACNNSFAPQMFYGLAGTSITVNVKTQEPGPNVSTFVI